MTDGTLTLRRATDADARAIQTLAGMQQADPLTGEILVAELDGHLIAALDVGSNRAVADINRPTAEIVGVLRWRREQIVSARRYSFVFGSERPRGRSRLRGLWRAVAA